MATEEIYKNLKSIDVRGLHKKNQSNRPKTCLLSGGIKSKVKILQHALSTEEGSSVTLEEKHLQYTKA